MVQEPAPAQSFDRRPRRIMIVGIILMLISVFLIFWNEGVGLHGMKPVQVEGYAVTPVPNSPINFNNNNQLIYTTGLLNTNNILQDPLLGYSEKAIKIERRVEMYQWAQSEETKKQTLPNGSEQEIVTYLYKPIWSKDLIDSTGFRDAVSHQNPVSMPLNSLAGQAQDVTVGDFHLDPELIPLIPGDEVVNLANVNASNIQQGTKQPVQHDGDYIYIGANPKTPAIGDVRISIHKVASQDVSIIAMQNQNNLQPLKIEGGKSIAKLALGQIPLNEMIHEGKSKNRHFPWLMRILTFILMIVGAGMVIAPRTTLPGTSPIMTSFLLGLGVWTILMAIAWFVVQPSWAITLLIIVIAIYSAIFAVLRRRHKQF